MTTSIVPHSGLSDKPPQDCSCPSSAVVPPDTEIVTIPPPPEHSIHAPLSPAEQAEEMAAALRGLAQQTLRMLDKQQDYFKASDPSAKQILLKESKRLEKELRNRCNALLAPPPPPATSLFAEDDTDADTPWWAR